FWVLLSQAWSGWRSAVRIVKPATVVCWHRRVFAWHWRWRSRRPRLGRPPIAVDARDLIQKMHLYAHKKIGRNEERVFSAGQNQPQRRAAEASAGFGTEEPYPRTRRRGSFN